MKHLIIEKNLLDDVGRVYCTLGQKLPVRRMIGLTKSWTATIVCGRCEREFLVRIPHGLEFATYECPSEFCHMKQRLGPMVW
jgi:hypothetical protein